MEFIFFLAVVTLIVFLISSTAGISRKQNRVMETLLAEAGRQLGLKLRKGGVFRQPALYGTMDGLQVVIRRYNEPEQETYDRIFITHRLPVSGLMWVSRERQIVRSVNELGGTEILTGDRAFDDAFRVTGTSAFQVAALFDSAIRKKLLDFSPKGVAINLTVSWLEVLMVPGLEAGHIAEIARSAVSISSELVKAGDTRGRLIEIIRNDPEPGVRARCIAHLAGHFPADDEITSVLRGSFRDTDIGVLIEAAKHIGKEGMMFLTRMLEGERKLDDEMVKGIVQAMGKNQYAGSVPALKKLFEQRPGIELELEILEAFRNIGDTGLSGFLLSYLKRRNNDVLRALLGALATCGTVEAVEPLLRFGKSADMFIREDVRNAIAGIQSRLGGADAGWLSVHDSSGAEGGLSMPAGKEGALSIEDASAKKNDVSEK